MNELTEHCGVIPVGPRKSVMNKAVGQSRKSTSRSLQLIFLAKAAYIKVGRLGTLQRLATPVVKLTEQQPIAGWCSAAA